MRLLERGNRRGRITVLVGLIAPLTTSVGSAAMGASTAAQAQVMAAKPASTHASPTVHPKPPPRYKISTNHFRSSQEADRARPQVHLVPPLSASGGLWTSLGPKPIADTPNANSFLYGNVSGRTTAVAVDPTNNQVIYLGTGGGGIWKSTDGGSNWTPKTDNQATTGIGALAIDPTNHLVIYAGTGEDNGQGGCNGACAPSQGVLKSTDGGDTWALLGNSLFGPAPQNFFSFDWITVDRLSGQHVLAGTSSGLFASTDGGTNWSQNTQILGVTGRISSSLPASGGTNVILQDPDIATTWYSAVADQCATEVGQVMKSTDNGANWAESTRFAHAGVGSMSRIGLGAGHGGTLYAAPSDCLGDLDSGGWKGSGSGATWTAMNSSVDWFKEATFTPPATQGWYDNVVAVDPNDANHAAFGGITIAVTKDGGASFSDVGKVYPLCRHTGCPENPVHADFHGLAFNGTLDHLYAGNDGGVYFTSNLGGTGRVADWTNLNATLQITTYYHGDALDLQHLAGGAQDVGTSAIYPGQTPAPPAFAMLDGADGGWVAFDPTPNSTKVYTEEQFGGVNLVDYSLINSTPNNVQSAGPCYSDTSPTPVGPVCGDPDLPLVTPFVMDPTNPQRLYLTGSYYVVRTTTGGRVPTDGTSWSVIGSPPIGRGRGDILTYLAVSPDGAELVVGNESGQIAESLNANTAAPGNVSWTAITGNLPLRSGANTVPYGDWFGSIVINPNNPAELWVSITGSLSIGRVYHTTNNGTSWTDISGSGSTALPARITKALTVNPDPATPFLYAGTDAGAFVCLTCAGNSPSPSWTPLGTSLPNVRIQQLEVTHDHKSLVAFTFGRGAWVLPITGNPVIPEAPFAVFIPIGGVLVFGAGFVLSRRRRRASRAM